MGQTWSLAPESNIQKDFKEGTVPGLVTLEITWELWSVLAGLLIVLTGVPESPLEA